MSTSLIQPALWDCRWNWNWENILLVMQDDKCGTSLKISTSSEPARLLPKAFQIKVEPADTGL